MWKGLPQQSKQYFQILPRDVLILAVAASRLLLLFRFFQFVVVFVCLFLVFVCFVCCFVWGVNLNRSGVPRHLIPTRPHVRSAPPPSLATCRINGMSSALSIRTNTSNLQGPTLCGMNSALSMQKNVGTLQIRLGRFIVFLTRNMRHEFGMVETCQPHWWGTGGPRTPKPSKSPVQ